MKYLSLLVAACLFLTALLTGCGSSTETPTQTTMETTTESMQGYTISELQDAIVEMLKRADPDYITPYMLPGAEQALEYAYQSYDSYTSVLVDIESKSLSEIEQCEYFTNANIASELFLPDADTEIIIYSSASLDDKEEFSWLLQEIQSCIYAVRYMEKINDVALFRIEGFAALFVQVSDGWFVFCFDI